jgi:hypothetical protein
MNDRTGVLFPRLEGNGRKRNAYAVEHSIRALRESGRLERIDAALLAAVRTTARALDAAPNPYVTATVARVHLTGLQLLTGRPAPEPDELDAFLASLRPAPVGDTPHT